MILPLEHKGGNAPASATKGAGSGFLRFPAMPSFRALRFPAASDERTEFCKWTEGVLC